MLIMDVFIESLLRSLNPDFMHFTKLNFEFSGERVCFCICLTSGLKEFAFVYV